METIVVKKDDENLRIDKFLNEYYKDISRNHIKNCIKNGDILVNCEKVKAGYNIKAGDEIEVRDIEPEEIDIKPQNIPIDILYEDEDVLVVNKPKDMVVHPAPGHYEDTLVNAIMYHCKDNLSGINGEIRPGIVHRIDKNTTGALIVCKNDKAHNYIAAQIKEHTIKRRYIGIVRGTFKELSGRIDKPIGRAKNDRIKMCVTDKNSKEAITNYRVISQNDRFSLVEFILETGRTHQIRVHMLSVGHPLLGDDLYFIGKKNKNNGYSDSVTTLEGVEMIGQCLHAETIGFENLSKKYIEIHASLPEYMETLIKKLGLEEKSAGE